MVRRHEWEILSYAFALKYDLGYRYLDRCGELMIVLEEEHGFIPGETKPTGAKLDNPDLGIFVEISTTELSLRQENVKDDGNAICDCASQLSELVLDYLSPAAPHYAGFMRSSYLSFDNEEMLHHATLRPDSVLHNELANEVSMVPQSQNLCHTFVSGSYELELNVREVTINTPLRRSFIAGFKANSRAQSRANRRNAAVLASVQQPASSFALLMELDLRERAPTVNGFTDQMKLLRSHAAKLENRYNAL